MQIDMLGKVIAYPPASLNGALRSAHVATRAPGREAAQYLPLNQKSPYTGRSSPNTACPPGRGARFAIPCYSFLAVRYAMHCTYLRDLGARSE